MLWIAAWSAARAGRICKVVSAIKYGCVHFQHRNISQVAAIVNRVYETRRAIAFGTHNAIVFACPHHPRLTGRGFASNCEGGGRPPCVPPRASRWENARLVQVEARSSELERWPVSRTPAPQLVGGAAVHGRLVSKSHLPCPAESRGVCGSGRSHGRPFGLCQGKSKGKKQKLRAKR